MTANNKALYRIAVVYDSAFGNTAKIARAIGEALEPFGPISITLAANTTIDDIADASLLIVGSPTQGGLPTKLAQDFLERIPYDNLYGVSVAAFDTRFALKEHGFGLQMLMRTIGFAARRIARELMARGGTLVAQPEGFIVSSKEGPLKQGEIDRAKAWALALLSTNRAGASQNTLATTH